MTRLFIETSTSICSLGLELPSGAFFVFHENLARNQHERILSEIQRLFEQAELEVKDLTGIVIGIGPGSFVGCRLAVALAQGLSAAFQIPILPLSSLQIGAQCYFEKALKNKILEGSEKSQLSEISVLNDAKLGELYWGQYILKNQMMMPEKPDQAIELSRFAEFSLEFSKSIKSNLFLTDDPQGLESWMGYRGFPFEVHVESMRALADGALPSDWRSAAEISPIYLRSKSQW